MARAGNVEISTGTSHSRIILQTIVVVTSVQYCPLLLLSMAVRTMVVNPFASDVLKCLNRSARRKVIPGKPLFGFETHFPGSAVIIQGMIVVRKWNSSRSRKVISPLKTLTIQWPCCSNLPRGWLFRSSRRAFGSSEFGLLRSNCRGIHSSSNNVLFVRLAENSVCRIQHVVATLIAAWTVVGVSAEGHQKCCQLGSTTCFSSPCRNCHYLHLLSVWIGLVWWDILRSGEGVKLSSYDFSGCSN